MFNIVIIYIIDYERKIKSISMKIASFFVLIIAIILSISCCTEESGPSERFTLITTPIWETDSLLVDGEDASGPGQILEKFKGDAKFNADGSGYFGLYSGTWRFAQNDTELVIITDSLPIPLTTKIAELTSLSLKITTAYPSMTNPEEEMKIRMTFNVK